MRGASNSLLGFLDFFLGVNNESVDLSDCTCMEKGTCGKH